MQQQVGSGSKPLKSILNFWANTGKMALINMWLSLGHIYIGEQNDSEKFFEKLVTDSLP